MNFLLLPSWYIHSEIWITASLICTPKFKCSVTFGRQVWYRTVNRIYISSAGSLSVLQKQPRDSLCDPDATVVLFQFQKYIQQHIDLHGSTCRQPQKFVHFQTKIVVHCTSVTVLSMVIQRIQCWYLSNIQQPFT